MFFRHALPSARIAVLEIEVLRIRAVAEEDGIFSLFGRSKDIGAQQEGVGHGDRYIPVDPHAIADLGPLVPRCHRVLPQFSRWPVLVRPDAQFVSKGYKDDDT